ncbi:MAG TPA: hypothetical protein DDW55_10150 [Gammaproteobacteria bacterium]|nr:hypothetical protein [Gammaproteobacteria bacterium]
MRGMTTVFIGLLLAVSVQELAAEGDASDSRDYAPIGRFDGAIISGYRDHESSEYLLQNGPVKQRGDSMNVVQVEGRVRLIAYKAPNGASISEVYRSYRRKLEDAGFRIVYKCYDKECGGPAFADSVPVLPLPKMVVDPLNYRYISASKFSGGQQTDAIVLISQDSSQQLRIQLTVVESGELKQKMVTAEEMLQGLAENGHIALYGIYFDPGKVELKAESRPVLDEIARLMRAQKNLKVILVGHTDNKGTYNHNINLSDQRARAIVKTLISEYSIASNRLRSNGVGYLAPVASNLLEEGRTLNRRVELVQAN